MGIKLKIHIKCLKEGCNRQEYTDSGNRTIDQKVIYHCLECGSKIEISS